MKTAREFFNEILANVDDWCAGGCDYNTFHVRQIAIWDSVYAAGKEVSDQVHGLLRDSLRGLDQINVDSLRGSGVGVSK